MRYQWNGENVITDVLAALAAAATGYATAYMAIKGKTKAATLTNAALGVGGVALKYYTGSPALHEVLEGVGYGGFAGLGTWAAGAVKNTSIPVWIPSKKTQSFVSAPTATFRPVSVAPQVSAVSAPAPAKWETEY